ncbi:MAG TPA: VOC family protein [Candidatus Limnocylindrales bacterium]
MNDQISPSDFHASTGVEDWRVVGDGACAYFATPSFEVATRFVAAIGRLDGAASHPPDIDVRSDGVTVRLVTRSAEWYGMSARDADVAAAISSAAHDLGLTGDPSQVQSYLVVPGAPETSAIIPFWRAVLGYEPRPDSPDEDLVDPHDRGPGFWFERMREPRGDGGGAIHFAVWVPPEQAEARVRAAVAAGGRIVRDEYAPSWWTLADAAGNEADVATIQGRD